jgi:hypothetical protein
MPMNAQMDTNAASAPVRWPRILLMAVAAVSTLSALTDITPAVINLTENQSAAQWSLTAGVVIHVVLALAALVLAIKRDVRRAIMALAAVTPTTWLLDLLPSVIMHGLDMEGTGGMIVAGQFFVLPLIALCALVLAWRNERLGLAALLAVVPTLLGMAMVVAFAISVMIYGF